MKKILLSLVLVSASAIAGVGHCPVSYTCFNTGNGKPCYVTHPSDQQNGLFPKYLTIQGQVAGGVKELFMETISGGKLSCYYDKSKGLEVGISPKGKVTTVVQPRLWEGDQFATQCKAQEAEDIALGCTFNYN